MNAQLLVNDLIADRERLKALNQELVEALQWAYEIAELAKGYDAALENPKYNEWLDKCRKALQAATQHNDLSINER